MTSRDILYIPIGLVLSGTFFLESLFICLSFLLSHMSILVKTRSHWLCSFQLRNTHSTRPDHFQNLSLLGQWTFNSKVPEKIFTKSSKLFMLNKCMLDVTYMKSWHIDQTHFLLVLFLAFIVLLIRWCICSFERYICVLCINNSVKWYNVATCDMIAIFWKTNDIPSHLLKYCV